MISLIVNNNIRTLVLKEAVPLPLPFLYPFLREFNEKWVSAKYCYAIHELRLHQNDRCKRFTLV